MSGLARRLARNQQRGGLRVEAATDVGVMISSPMMDMCHTQFCVSLANLIAHTAVVAPPNLYIGFHQFGTSILQYAREALAKKSLEQKATHILWIDSDMEFPPDLLVRLLRHDVDIVGANCIARRPPFNLTARDESGKQIPTNPDSTGLEKVASVGFGVLMHRIEVLHAIPEPWFDFEWNRESEFTLITGEDVRFCKRARAAGFDIYIDHDLSKQVNHVGMFGYNPLFKSAVGQEKA